MGAQLFFPNRVLLPIKSGRSVENLAASLEQEDMCLRSLLGLGGCSQVAARIACCPLLGRCLPPPLLPDVRSASFGVWLEVAWFRRCVGPSSDCCSGGVVSVADGFRLVSCQLVRASPFCLLKQGPTAHKKWALSENSIRGVGRVPSRVLRTAYAVWDASPQGS